MSAKTLEDLYQKLRAEREALEAAARAVTYPTPEHTSRDPWPDDFVAPGPAVSLRLLAESHGFTVAMTYARGYPPHRTTGRPTSLRHSVAVRLVHPQTRRAGYAVTTSPVAKLGWTWDSVMVWGTDVPPFPYASITDMKEWIKARGEVDARWYAAIRRRLRDAEAKKAARLKGSGRKKGVMS